MGESVSFMVLTQSNVPKFFERVEASLYGASAPVDDVVRIGLQKKAFHAVENKHSLRSLHHILKGFFLFVQFVCITPHCRKNSTFSSQFPLATPDARDSR